MSAVSMAWGMWDLGMGAGLSTVGVPVMTVAEGLELFGRACTRDEPVLVPAKLNLSALHGKTPRCCVAWSGHPFAGGPPSSTGRCVPTSPHCPL